MIFPILTIDSYRSLMTQLPGLPSERHGCTCRPRNAVEVGNQDPVPASWVMHSHSFLIFFGSYSASFRMKAHFIGLV